MAYRLELHEQVADGVRRIALELIDKAVEGLALADRHEAIHEVRKRCKKIRALLRLVRPALGQVYKTENAWFRDTARLLSDLRDATSLIETCDALRSVHSGEVDDGVFTAAREALLSEREALLDSQNLEECLGRVREALVTARARVATWRLDEDRFTVVAGGLGKTYRRARRTMRAAYEKPTTAAFHEWRKRVKYHRYHLQILRDIWRPMMDTRESQAHALTDLLGDDHNLALLQQRLQGTSPPGPPDARAVLEGLAGQQRAHLRERARFLGSLLLAEKPSTMLVRYRAYWRAARADRLIVGPPPVRT